MGPADSSPSKRLSFLDLFRGAFALLMMEGHVLRALMDPALMQGAGFRLHESVHSLTGPAFLFTSGIAFSFATLSRWELYHRWSAKLGRRLMRFVFLLFIGYMLHLTYFSLRRTVFESTPDQLATLLAMDILQCIAMSGLLLQLIVVLAPNERWFFGVTAAGCIVMGLTTPLVWSAARQLPLWLGTNLSGHWGSVFPLSPHLGFYFAGAAGGYLFVQFRRRKANDSAIRLDRRRAAWLVLVMAALFLLPIPLSYGSEFGDIGPDYFFPRLGLLAILMVLFYFIGKRDMASSDSLALLGRESLLVYTSHLILLYGSPLNPERNLVKYLGSRHDLATVLLVFLLVAGIAFCLSWLWNRLKQEHDWKIYGLRWSLAGYFIYAFVFG